MGELSTQCTGSGLESISRRGALIMSGLSDKKPSFKSDFRGDSLVRIRKGRDRTVSGHFANSLHGQRIDQFDVSSAV